MLLLLSVVSEQGWGQKENANAAEASVRNGWRHDGCKKTEKNREKERGEGRERERAETEEGGKETERGKGCRVHPTHSFITKRCCKMENACMPRRETSFSPPPLSLARAPMQLLVSTSHMAHLR